MKTIKIIAIITFLLITAKSHAAPIYKIEVLVFENIDTINRDNEQWRQLNDYPSDFNSVNVETAEGVIRLLPSSNLTLNQARERLSASGDYQIIYHKAWSQAVRSKEENTSAWIEIPGVFEGTINLYQKRYLHLDVDLSFNSLDGTVRLNETRRLKQKELNYFDHPLFGLLVRVVKL